MARRADWRRELDEEYAFSEEDEALLRHVLLDDQGPPQGLHQGGHGRRRQKGEPEEWEDRAVEEFLYPVPAEMWEEDW